MKQSAQALEAEWAEPGQLVQFPRGGAWDEHAESGRGERLRFLELWVHESGASSGGWS